MESRTDAKRRRIQAQEDSLSLEVQFLCPLDGNYDTLFVRAFDYFLYFAYWGRMENGIYSKLSNFGIQKEVSEELVSLQDKFCLFTAAQINAVFGVIHSIDFSSRVNHMWMLNNYAHMCVFTFQHPDFVFPSEQVLNTIILKRLMDLSIYEGGMMHPMVARALRAIPSNRFAEAARYMLSRYINSHFIKYILPLEIRAIEKLHMAKVQKVKTLLKMPLSKGSGGWARVQCLGLPILEEYLVQEYCSVF